MSTDLLALRGTPIAATPRRIVSLYPSGTETLYALGLSERVVGRTSWCPQPDDREPCPAMGGTKNPDLARIQQAAPDLVLACRDENRREDVEAIEKFAPVLVADLRRVADVAPFVRQLAAVSGADSRRGEELAAAIEIAAASVRPAPLRRAVAFIWREPWWTIGGNCYPTDLLRLLGLENVFAADARSWFALDAADIAAARPDVLLFPDEPFRFDSTHIDALRAAIPLLKHTPARLFDGSLLTWHGARTLEALRRLPEILA